MGIFTKNIIRFKGRKNHANIFELNIIMVNIKKRGHNNFNNFDDNKDYKKIRIFKPNKYYSEREKLEF